MAFNFKLLFSVVLRTFWRTRGTHAQLTLKRIAVIIIVFPSYVVIEIANWLGFLLDDIFFPAYSRQAVHEPVFIIGVQRSGTTFLHRLLNNDSANFTSMKMWEIMFAPSVIQKKIFTLLGVLDDMCGSPLTKLILKSEARLFSGMADFHKNSFFAVEEDEFILVHIFSSLFLITVFPFAEILRPFVFFDSQLTAKQQASIMAFYKRCVQNHLYVFGRDKHFLSKNPFFSGMIQSLNKIFPDAKFLCMVRTPLETVPSAISMWSACFHFFLSPQDPLPLLDAQQEIITHYYRYPLEQLDAMSSDRQQIVTYPALVTGPARIANGIYKNFNLAMTQAFMLTLQREEEKARRYESSHAYSLEQFSLSREQLLKDYADIFDRFGFEKKA